MVEIDLCPLEIRYRQCGARRARVVVARGTRVGLAMYICLVAMTYVTCAAALLQSRRSSGLSEIRELHGKLHDRVEGKRRTDGEKAEFDRNYEGLKRVTELLALLERDTNSGVSFVQLVAHGDAVLLRGEATDISSLQTFLSYLVSQLEGSTASIESVRDERSERNGSGKQFSVMITLRASQE